MEGGHGRTRSMRKRRLSSYFRGFDIEDQAIPVHDAAAATRRQLNRCVKHNNALATDCLDHAHKDKAELSPSAEKHWTLDECGVAEYAAGAILSTDSTVVDAEILTDLGVGVSPDSTPENVDSAVYQRSTETASATSRFSTEQYNGAILSSDSARMSDVNFGCSSLKGESANDLRCNYSPDQLSTDARDTMYINCSWASAQFSDTDDCAEAVLTFDSEELPQSSRSCKKESTTDVNFCAGSNNPDCKALLMQDLTNALFEYGTELQIFSSSGVDASALCIAYAAAAAICVDRGVKNSHVGKLIQGYCRIQQLLCPVANNGESKVKRVRFKPDVICPPDDRVYESVDEVERWGFALRDLVCALRDLSPDTAFASTIYALANDPNDVHTQLLSIVDRSTLTVGEVQEQAQILATEIQRAPRGHCEIGGTRPGKTRELQYRCTWTLASALRFHLRSLFDISMPSPPTATQDTPPKLAKQPTPTMEIHQAAPTPRMKEFSTSWPGCPSAHPCREWSLSYLFLQALWQFHAFLAIGASNEQELEPGCSKSIELWLAVACDGWKQTQESTLYASGTHALHLYQATLAGERARAVLESIMGNVEQYSGMFPGSVWQRMSRLADAIAEISGPMGDEGYLVLLHDVQLLRSLVKGSVCNFDFIEKSRSFVGAARKGLLNQSKKRLHELHLHTPQDIENTKSMLKSSPWVFNFPTIVDVTTSAAENISHFHNIAPTSG